MLSSLRTAAKGGSSHLSRTFLSNINLCISQPRPSSQCLRPASVSGAVIGNTGRSTISECRHTSRRWGKGDASRQCRGLGAARRDERAPEQTLVYVCRWGIAMKIWGLSQARHFSNISPSPFIRNTELTWPIHLSLSEVFPTAVLTILCLCVLMPRLCGGLQGTVTSAFETQKWTRASRRTPSIAQFSSHATSRNIFTSSTCYRRKATRKRHQKVDLAAPP